MYWQADFEKGADLYLGKLRAFPGLVIATQLNREP
jgi:hypothetical protein